MADRGAAAAPTRFFGLCQPPSAVELSLICLSASGWQHHPPSLPSADEVPGQRISTDISVLLQPLAGTAAESSGFKAWLTCWAILPARASPIPRTKTHRRSPCACASATSPRVCSPAASSRCAVDGPTRTSSSSETAMTAGCQRLWEAALLVDGSPVHASPAPAQHARSASSTFQGRAG